ncbi:MAG: hypothetical protein WC356_02335 [Candidatus Micrarchaeia archaeon]|jgi:hypothetical protein
MPDPEDHELPEGEEGSEGGRLTLAHLMDHPDADPSLAAPPTPEEEAAAAEADRQAALEAETPEQKAEREAAEAAAKPPEFTPKHKTWEETEGAREEAERRMHEATTKAAEEKVARETLEAELAELRAAKPPEKEEEPPVPPATPEERKKKLFEVARTANKKAVAKIRELDTQDPDYDDHVAGAWAEANAEALLESGMGSTAGLSREEVSNLVKEQVKAEREAEKAAKAERDIQDESTRAYNKALDLAKASGLDMEEDSADRIMFDALASKMPNELKNKGVEAIHEKVDWVVAGVKQKLGRVVEQTEAQRQAALANQNRNRPLGKGADFSSSKEPLKRKTLSEIMDQISP